MGHASGGGEGGAVEWDSKQCWVRDLLIEVHAARQKIKDKQLHPTAVCSYECPARSLFLPLTYTPLPLLPLCFYFTSCLFECGCLCCCFYCMSVCLWGTLIAFNLTAAAAAAAIACESVFNPPSPLPRLLSVAPTWCGKALWNFAF